VGIAAPHAVDRLGLRAICVRRYAQPVGHEFPLVLLFSLGPLPLKPCPAVLPPVAKQVGKLRAHASKAGARIVREYAALHSIAPTPISVVSYGS
jgi:hypothetical protein